MSTKFAHKPLVQALANIGGEPPKCVDCVHRRDFKEGRFFRPDEEQKTIPGVMCCYDEELNRGLPCEAVRADEAGCGPDGDWFAPRIVVVQ